MPLSDEQEQAEYELRMAQMQQNIEKLRSDIRYESRKFMLQSLVAAAALVGAGAALGNYVANRGSPPAAQAPPSVFVYVLPGTGQPPVPVPPR